MANTNTTNNLHAIKEFILSIDSVKLFSLYIKIIIFEILLIVSIKLNIATQEFDQILSIIITVSGIFSGILIAYITSKLFQLIAERQNRKIEIDKLSDKLTHFRKLCYYVIKSHNFWKKHEDIGKFKTSYGSIKYEDLHSDLDRSGKRKEFWDDNTISKTTIDLWLAFKAVVDDPNESPYWIYDPLKKFSYSLKQLSKYYDPSGQISYYLIVRYNKNTLGLIEPEFTNRLDIDNLSQHLAAIEPKFKTQNIDKDLIGDVANEVYEIYIPQLYKLIEQNQKGMPSGLKTMVMIIILIIIFGVIIPIINMVYVESITFKYMLTKVSCGTLIFFFIFFIISYLWVLKSEIKLNS